MADAGRSGARGTRASTPLGLHDHSSQARRKHLQSFVDRFKAKASKATQAQSRVKMLGMLADKRIPLLAYHFAWPGVGHVARQGEGFRYYPEGMKMQEL